MEEKILQEKCNMLGTIYNTRQEELGKITKELKEKLNPITLEEVLEILAKNIEDTEKQKETIQKLNLLIENDEIKMASFIETAYKQGFKDAFQLFMECEKK
mgnify:CR=1 FL=1